MIKGLIVVALPPPPPPFFSLTKGPISRRSPTIGKDERERKWKEVISQMGQHGRMTTKRPIGTPRGKSKVNGQ